ncbi:MAG: GAF and ANTAR domain-containing protein [Acidimicrobiales bacterium]
MANTDELAIELERELATAARSLLSLGTVDDTLQKTVELARATIDGCDLAGVFLVRDEQVTTPAHTDPSVVALHAMQFETDEGPCLDAVAEGGTFYAEDLAEDVRWPRFGPLAAAAGIRSLLAFGLSGDGTLGALNLYAHYPRAFGATDRAKGLILATLAGSALGWAHTREEDARRTDNLHFALLSRELVGQAQGILMERERITADQAFDILRRASQHLNVKLREVAQTLVETGERPPTGQPRPGRTA